MNEKIPLTDYRKISLIVLGAIIAVGICIYVGLQFIFKSNGIEKFEIDSLLAVMISVATGVYISITIYIFAKKQEYSRKLFLIKQIVAYFELLQQGYGNDISSRHRNPDGRASELRINESFFNQKNAVALHIFDNVTELGNKINTDLAEFIKDVSLHALGFPEIKKNTKGEYLEPDYSQYKVFLHGMNVIIDFLTNKRKDFESIPEEKNRILNLQQEFREN